MNFIERLLELLSEKGISKNKMLVDLGLAKGSIVNWQERGTTPSGETLSKISKYLDVSIDYLMCTSDEKKPTTLTDSELMEFLQDPVSVALFKNLKALSPQDRASMLAQMEAIIKLRSEQEN